jgi:hypothetical protein
MMATAASSGKPWTAQEDTRLRELAASGATLAEIAEKLDRTESGTKTRAYILRVTFGRLGADRRTLDGDAKTGLKPVGFVELGLKAKPR